MTRLSESQSGIGRKVIFIIIILLVIAGVVTWRLSANSSTNRNGSSPSVSTNNVSNDSSPCLNAYHDSILCAFALHSNILSYSYIATGTAITTSGTTAGFTVKNDGKGNHEVVYIANGEQYSSITFAGTRYVQLGVGAAWTEYSNGSPTNSSVPDPTSGFNLSFTNASSHQYSFINEGTTACGNLNCNDYKVTLLAEQSITQYVYFDTGSHLLRKWTYSDPSTGVSVVMTVDYQSVKITKPSPVQQVTP